MNNPDFEKAMESLIDRVTYEIKKAKRNVDDYEQRFNAYSARAVHELLMYKSFYDMIQDAIEASCSEEVDNA